MSHATQTITPGQLMSVLFEYRNRWIIPAVVVALLAGFYAFVRPATWEASQALIVRNEVAGNQDVPGTFRHSGEMKTVQETILELVKSRKVLWDTLMEVGPADGRARSASWPSDKDVAELREAVKITPPNGAEFGMTEVFYLQVRDASRDRSVALVAEISDQLETRFQQLRDTKAQSMISELAKAVKVARDDLDESTDKLTGIEKQVGSDLAELRSLQEQSSGDTALRRTISEIRGELRQAGVARQSSQELLALLESARDDPDRLVATPNGLLESHPALRRLKEGLVDAQLRTAGLRGSMSDRHPLVRAAKESEQKIRRHLHDELAAAVRGLQFDLQVSADRVATLEDQLAAPTERLDRLAALRAGYSNQVAETNNRAQLLEGAEQKLSEARMSQATTKAASLIGRIDSPEAGIDPVGPSRRMIALAGLAGGLLAGFGVLFLTVEVVQPVPTPADPTVLPDSTTSRETDHDEKAATTPNKILPLKWALKEIMDAQLGV